ncbi:MAG: carboxypeptidase-like regulatory domain-containing protein [Olleya sp.]
MHAQTVELSGSVSGEEDIENIHILNKTSLTNATSNKEGKFRINAKLNDTIIFTAVQYKTLTRVVTAEDIATKTLNVFLELFTNELDEVFIVEPLSGNLEDDVTNLDVKPDINFYDVGIPGYKGKPKTQAERRLFEAGELKVKDVLLGALSGAIPLNPIINAISGRTKELKEIVRLENDDALLARLKNDLAADFFASNPLDEKHHVEFFYFVQEDKDFRTVCSKSNLDALAFFKKKLDEYNKNLSQKD